MSSSVPRSLTDTSSMLILSISILSMLIGVGCRMAEDPIPVDEPASMRSGQQFPTLDPSAFISNRGCFHVNRSYCRSDQPCYRLLPNAVVCCDVDSETLKESLSLDRSFSQQVLYLHVINATMEVLDASQSIWRALSSIAITDGNIRNISGDFKKISQATCLNISNNNIVEISNRCFVNLFNLSMLDMSYNNLIEIPRFNGKGKDIFLNFKGNNQTLCKHIEEILETHVMYLKFVDANSTFCTSSKSFHWFNTTELVPIEQVELVQEIKKHCGEPALEIVNCSCVMVRLDIVAGKTPTFSVGVDCSNRHLKQLPSKLPPNTIELNVTSNNITSLKPLSDHPSYEHVRQLYADDNNIQSILDLEGTKFIDNFIVLSLRSNKLKTIPTYILSDSFDRNWSPRQVFLGKNYLNCDCTTTRQVKLWLLSKTNNIPDYDEVMCENMPGKLIELAESKVCPQTKDCTDYIYYVIAIEVILLFGLIAKVFYDYWVYKTAGYLPWPASEMPKLPCDWLCE